MARGVGAGRRQRHPPPRAAPSLDTSSAGVLSRPFQLGVPAFDAFPRKVWKRLAGRHLRSLDTAAMGYPEAAGYEPLRRAIVNYLVSSRGVACTYEQVFVTAGYPGALDLICRTLLKTGDVGWYEDPGYLFARQFLQRSGMQLQPVPVDEEGLNLGEGLKQSPAARFAVVTPAHQSPTGVALSLPRRLQLLDWASQVNGWVIEDDYDSEFRYHGRPLPALSSLDDNDRVLYTGSFSKVLFPGLRLAYLVVPKTPDRTFRRCSRAVWRRGILRVTGHGRRAHGARALLPSLAQDARALQSAAQLFGRCAHRYLWLPHGDPAPGRRTPGAGLSRDRAKRCAAGTGRPSTRTATPGIEQVANAPLIVGRFADGILRLCNARTSLRLGSTATSSAG